MSYFVVNCKKCGKYSMSSSRNHAKCAYCKSAAVCLVSEFEKPRDASKSVAEKNSLGKTAELRSLS